MLDHQSASDPQLPLTSKAAIYTRVATPARRTHIPQTDDVLALAQEQGYLPEQITIYEDVGVSGKTPIESREGLRALVTAIQQGSIQTVFTFAEDRLFRDANMLQISLFLKACFEHDVQLVTSQTVYDFTNPALVTLFKSRCEQGTLSIERAVQKRLLTGRAKKRETKE